MYIKFNFKNESRRFFSGQLVEGNVIVESKEYRLINKLCLYMKGLTSVKFVKNGKKYKDQMTHLNKKMFAVGYKYGKSKTVLHGSRIIPFSFKLPDELPSSVKGAYGSTKYTIKARAFTKRWHSTNSDEEEISVINLVDLNQVTNADTPLAIFETRVNQDATRPFGFITAKLNSMSCGFVPGQVIPFTIETVNETGKNVIGTNFTFIKRTKYKVRKPEVETKITDDVVECVPLGPLNNNEAKALRVSLQIPLLPPSGLKSCELLDIEYWVKVIFKMADPKDNFVLSELVVIGNLPMSKLDSVFQGIKFT